MWGTWWGLPPVDSVSALMLLPPPIAYEIVEAIDKYERGEVTSDLIANALFEQVQRIAQDYGVNDAGLKLVWEAASKKGDHSRANKYLCLKVFCVSTRRGTCWGPDDPPIRDVAALKLLNR